MSSLFDISKAQASHLETDHNRLVVFGRGMIARAARVLFQPAQPVLLFAAGTGNSATVEADLFERERTLLLTALQRCEREHRRLIYCSSAGRIYDIPSDTPISENSPCRPVCAYGRNKLACEELVHSSRGPHIILRLANLIGPSQNAHQLLPALLQQVRAGSVQLQAGASRDLLAVEHLFPMLDEILANTASAETVVAATGISTPVGEILQWIRDCSMTEFDIHVVNQGTPQVFCINKLRHLAPQHAAFLAEYPRAVVEKYLALAEFAK